MPDVKKLFDTSAQGKEPDAAGTGPRGKSHIIVPVASAAAAIAMGVVSVLMARSQRKPPLG